MRLSPYDADNCLVNPGDWVRCVVGYYCHMKMGSIHKVMDVDRTCVHLFDSNYGDTNRFKAGNFRLISSTEAADEITAQAFKRRRPIQYLRENSVYTFTNISLGAPMLYIATRIDMASHADWSVDLIAERFNGGSSVWNHMDANLQHLKEWVRLRIVADPKERWLILIPSEIGETSSPPVRFVRV